MWSVVKFILKLPVRLIALVLVVLLLMVRTVCSVIERLAGFVSGLLILFFVICVFMYVYERDWDVAAFCFILAMISSSPSVLIGLINEAIEGLITGVLFVAI